MEPRGRWSAALLVSVALLLVGAGAMVLRDLSRLPAFSLSKVFFEQGVIERPAIAVLPFTNPGDDPGQDYFSDGMTEDLITDLSRISGLLVIARNSVFAYKGKAVTIEQVGRELGVRYVLEGSVRRAGEKVQITAQLVDTATGAHVWADRYDRDLQDIFAVQDEITEKIAFALKVTFTPEEQSRFRYFPTDNLEAYDYVLRGREYCSKEANKQGRRLLEQAIALDPEYAGAYAALSEAYLLDWLFQWSPEYERSLERASELAHRAVALDDALPLGHLVLGMVSVWKGQHDRALAEANRAIELDPNFADGYGGRGRILNWAGRPDGALLAAEKMKRLNPHDLGSPAWVAGHAYSLLGRYQEAIAALKRALTHNPDFQPANLWLVIIYSELGREAEAFNELKKTRMFRSQTPLESLRQRAPYKDPAVFERVRAAFRKIEATLQQQQG